MDIKMIKPSPSELPLLKALWSKSELSARELHEHIADNRDWSLSSTRKTLERMVDKGMVTCEERHGVRVYKAAIGKISTLAAMTRQFARVVLEIDGPLPASSFGGSKILSAEELAELKRLLDEETDK
jgi:predicted transcriptional regulator